MKRIRPAISRATTILLTVVVAPLGCVAVVSATTSTPGSSAPPTITVTRTADRYTFDQPTTTTYKSVLSHNSCSRGSCTANEYADVTIKAYPNLSPGGGTVTFTDAHDELICVATLESNSLDTVASCTGFYFSVPPRGAVTAVYSGTRSGYGDGHGATYAGSSGSGRPR